MPPSAPASSGSPLTEVLRRFCGPDAAAGEPPELLQQVYAQLRAIAARQLANERAGHTLSPNALVHEAWLRLLAEGSLEVRDRQQFFAIAARRMRQVLVDHARRRNAAKRGHGAAPEALTLSALPDAAAHPAHPAQSAGAVDLLALDQALQQLEAIDERKARVVELRYFSGLEMSDIASLLGISRATAQRDWEVARSFLYQALA